jgi:hypothetical protein
MNDILTYDKGSYFSNLRVEFISPEGDTIAAGAPTAISLNGDRIEFQVKPPYKSRAYIENRVLDEYDIIVFSQRERELRFISEPFPFQYILYISSCLWSEED